MGMHLKIFDHLPKTDCRKCGRNSCLVFAAEVAQRQTCIEACPDITGEAEKALRSIIAAEHEMVSWLGGMISGISRNHVKSALMLLSRSVRHAPGQDRELAALHLPSHPPVSRGNILAVQKITSWLKNGAATDGKRR